MVLGAVGALSGFDSELLAVAADCEAAVDAEEAGVDTEVVDTDAGGSAATAWERAPAERTARIPIDMRMKSSIPCITMYETLAVPLFYWLARPRALQQIIK